MVNYIVKSKKNPISGNIAYYPQIGKQDFVDVDQVANDISGMCTVTKSDIMGVLSALQEEIETTLKNGQSVRFGHLGSFRPTITSNPHETKEEVNASSIKRVRVRFSPGGFLRRNLRVSTLKFVRDKEETVSDGE